MSNYNNGKIYKLVSQFTDMIYIGSTVQTLKQRKNTHLFETKNNYTNSSANMFIWDDCEIKLIENYSCNSKKGLVEREQYYINLYSDYCINLRNAVCDKKERNKRHNNSEKRKIWLRENREDQKEKRRKRNQTNQLKLQLQQRQYRQDFKAEKAQMDRLYKQYLKSMGGDPRHNNCLARIDPTLFS